MFSLKARILVASILLIFNEHGVKKTHAAIDNEFSAVRSKRTTICVEIKPNGPLEEPYYMCKGTEIPRIVSPQSQYSNIGGGSNQQQGNQNAPIYDTKNNFKAPFNVQDGEENNANFENSYDAVPANDKNNNSPPEAVQPTYSKQYNGNKGEMIPFKKAPSKAEGFYDTKQPQSASYQKPFPATEFKQRSQPQQHQQFRYQQPTYANQQSQSTFNQQTPTFRQPSTQFVSSAPPPAPNQLPNARYYQGTNGQPTFRIYGKTNSPQSFFQYPSYGSTAYATPQYRGDFTACGNDCEEVPNKAAAENAPSSFSDEGNREGSFNAAQLSSTRFGDHGNGEVGFNQEKFAPSFTDGGSNTKFTQRVFNKGTNSRGESPNADTIPAHEVMVSPGLPKDSYALANVDAKQPSSSSSSQFVSSTSNVANEDSNIPPMAANLPNLPINMKLGTPMQSSSFRAQPAAVDNHQSMNFMQRQRQPVLPAAHRYRAMIDDEVLQVPNWGFSTDELDFYPNSADVEPELFPSSPTLRTFPIEHLADPALRKFYSSLPDVGPLPLYEPENNNAFYSYPQPPKPRPIQTYTAPMENVQVGSQQTTPTCAPCVGNSQNQYQNQYRNQNSYNVLGGYKVQPVFVALPCYNPSALQPMMQQIQQASYEANSNNDMRSMNTNTAVASAEKRPNTTPATVSLNNSEESGESVEVSSIPTDVKSSIESNSNTNSAMSLSSKEKVAESPSFSSLKGSDTTTSAAMSIVGAANSATTPSSADIASYAKSSSSFPSLYINARKLAQQHLNNEEFNSSQLDISTPKSTQKRQRQAFRAVINGHGNVKRRFAK